jgi:MSHA pilin protein MshD
MCTTERQARGFTLIELLIFIVVVSAGMAGILAVMDSTVKASADPMLHKQAMALADSILEEILLKAYCDPDPAGAPAPACGPHVVKASRADYDMVDDFDRKTNADFSDLPTELASYKIDIVVSAPASLAGVTMKKVTVTVKHGSDSIAMTGYRANY